MSRRPFAQTRAAMPANVEEGVYPAAAVAREYEALARAFGDEEIAGARQRFFASDAQPLRGEDFT